MFEVSIDEDLDVSNSRLDTVQTPAMLMNHSNLSQLISGKFKHIPVSYDSEL